MKNLFLAITLVLSPFMFSGCSSTPNKTAYVAVGVTTSTVESARQAFEKWRDSHPLTVEQKQAYADALYAYKSALKLVESSKAMSLSGLSDPLLEQKASDAAAALFNIIASIAPTIAKGN